MVTLLAGSRFNEATQALRVPAGTWQGARLSPTHATEHGWALVSCDMTPAWSETGFVPGARKSLLVQFPAAGLSIRSLTR